MKIPLEIKTQGNTDFCFGCSIASVAEEYVGEPCDESYSFAAGKRYSLRSSNTKALQPRFALMGAIKYGVLPKRFSPYSIATHERDFLANFDIWEDLRKHAVYPFKSIKKITGGFNEIAKVAENHSVLLGLYWQPSWNKSPYIDDLGENTKYEPHEVRVIGVLDGRLVIQNSKGADKGDGGLWYMSSFAGKLIYHAYILSSEKSSFIKNLIQTL